MNNITNEIYKTYNDTFNDIIIEYILEEDANLNDIINKIKFYINYFISDKYNKELINKDLLNNIINNFNKIEFELLANIYLNRANKKYNIIINN
jgi:hypothetical protein